MTPSPSGPQRMGSGESRRPARLPVASQGSDSRRNRDERDDLTTIVGVGASAGGLEALLELVGALKPELDVATVVVTHQHASTVTLLPELLARGAHCPVHALRDAVSPLPGHIYVTPPGSLVRAGVDVLLLEESDGQIRPIDWFLQSLAEARGDDAIAVILSGSGSDGSAGSAAIKDAGGLVIVQDQQTARFGEMPANAATATGTELVLRPSLMPAEIARFVAFRSTVSKHRRADIDGALHRILGLLHARVGHDFTGYKKSTLLRRVDRRMAARNFDSVEQYTRYATAEPVELDLLFREILISVTSFFRDPQAFDSLKKELGEAMARRTDDHHPFRVWVCACATGEEAYSIAILLRELTLETGRSLPIQIFATDLDHHAISVARSGRYPLTISAHVSPERLEKFFVKGESEYRISREVRDLVVFAPQNVTHDPPFTRLDFVSCRNLLIYLETGIQRRVLELFAAALSTDGLLLLGSSESIGRFEDTFEGVDKKQKIFRRKPRTPEATAALLAPRREPAKAPARQPDANPAHRGVPVVDSPERILLDHFAPPSIVVTEQGEITFFHGRTGQFLQPPTGEPSMNVFAMIREELESELRPAMREAAGAKLPVVRSGIRVAGASGPIDVTLTIRHLESHRELGGHYLISFEVEPEMETKSEDDVPLPPGEYPSKVAALELELSRTRASLQGTVEAFETSNEELKSTNEELQSTNEELQSANEELETSREEMQSLNEELQTVNAELEERNRALSQANDDMQNLLNSTDIATVFLDGKLAIKRFTTPARKVFSLIDTDVGRPISDLTANLRHDALLDDAREVLRTLVLREREVQTKEGSWRLMRIMPYRTAENVIDGLVMTFVDVDPIRREERSAREARLLGDDVMDTLEDCIAVLDDQLRFLTANRAFMERFGTSSERLVGNPIDAALTTVRDAPALMQRLRDTLVTKSRHHLVIELDDGSGGHQTLDASLRPFESRHGGDSCVLLVLALVTP